MPEDADATVAPSVLPALFLHHPGQLILLLLLALAVALGRWRWSRRMAHAVVGGALAGEVALVTGAAGGLGARIAARLAACGARVVLWDRDAAALDSVGGSRPWAARRRCSSC